MKRLGLIVNPIAGMGGKVGLKGTDGEGTLKKACALGATPEAPLRAAAALKEISRLKDEIQLITAPFEMGENSAKAAGFLPLVIGKINSGKTTYMDSIAIAKEMAAEGVDLLAFAGGDGMACNMYQALGNNFPMLGIPAGVKIHSAVYAVNPKGAGRAIADVFSGKNIAWKEAEVMDIDEQAFRQGRIEARLCGYLKVPVIRDCMQSMKTGGYSEKNELQSIAAEIKNRMEADVYYIFGPGTTTRFIMGTMGIAGTLLGVDVVRNKKLKAADVNEQYLFHQIQGKKACIVVTIIGGQGHVFGRGNQQLSPRIIRMIGKENILVAASKRKIVDISPNPLIADTGDEELNKDLSGWIRVITGQDDSVMVRLQA